MTTANLAYMVMHIKEGGDRIEVQYTAQEEVQLCELATETELTIDYEDLESIYKTIAAVKFALS
jgi:glutathione peroxidase-family protein